MGVNREFEQGAFTPDLAEKILSPLRIMFCHGQYCEPNDPCVYVCVLASVRNENREKERLQIFQSILNFTLFFLLNEKISALVCVFLTLTHTYLSVSVHLSSSSRAILSILCFSSSLVVMSLASWWRFWVSNSPCETDTVCFSGKYYHVIIV